MSSLRQFVSLLVLAALAACNSPVLDPAGDIAAQQRDLLVDSTLLMLIIILPVMGFTAWFAWRYRASNKAARYEPEWDHSIHLELLIWSAPLLIIICLGALTWLGTHLLDPYRDLTRLSSKQEIARDEKPLEIEVVALDWKWLFIYPEYGIASVNDLAAPLNRPIDFHITASNVMNSFYIPTLAGQIYAMPAMETRLHAVINKAGDYQGFSANYSGEGFSRMRFKFHGQSESEFSQWVGEIKAGGGMLDRDTYKSLAKPSIDEPVRRYAATDSRLYGDILNLCIDAGDVCNNEMRNMNDKNQPDHSGHLMPNGDDKAGEEREGHGAGD